MTPSHEFRTESNILEPNYIQKMPETFLIENGLWDFWCSIFIEHLGTEKIPKSHRIFIRDMLLLHEQLLML